MIGQRLAQYEIEAEIGKGGMGTVYRARQLSLDRDVAIKVLSSEQALSPTSLERFRREGAAVAKIAHANIVQVLDVGTEQGVHYIVMEFVEGRTVSKILKEDGPFGFKDAVWICSQIASALGVMHEVGLIHRDIKPSNILVGRRQLAKLADFGVAALSEVESGERLTMTRTTVGTPYYMSPEQVKARVTLDGASDVYSLGVVLYEMLAGEHPFGDVTPTEAMMQQVNEAFPPIRRYRQNIPDDLERVLERILSKDRAERHANGAELHADLEKVHVRLGTIPVNEESGGEYRSRMTGTSFFYVDPTVEGTAAPGRIRGVLREAYAQLMDPNRTQRRRTTRLYRESIVLRDRYKQAEKQWDELKKRLDYHEQKAKGHRETGEHYIAEGRADEAGAEAEKESHHQKLGLDYRMQVDETGRQAGELRSEYDRSRQAHSESADELALLDADARRRGQWIPYGRENPTRVRQALWLRRIMGGAAIVAALTMVLLWIFPAFRAEPLRVSQADVVEAKTVPAVQIEESAPRVRLGGSENGVWKNTGSSYLPPARTRPGMIWTGKEVLVFGGVGADGRPNGTLDAYNAQKDQWQSIKVAGAPGPRLLHSVVWTDRELIIWGGNDGRTTLASGGKFNPELKTWSPVSTHGAPSPRQGHCGVWSGKEMLVWGGTSGNDGSRYDPDRDSWRPITTQDAPEGREFFTAVWSGKELIVWGGCSVGSRSNLGNGGKYDPYSDRWTPISTVNAPAKRRAHSAVWTGSRMLIWGGIDESRNGLASGASYDPASDTWTRMSDTDAPAGRSTHSAVWSADKMIVWGGWIDSETFTEGGCYDPKKDKWLPTAVGSATEARGEHGAVWSGTALIVYGGRQYDWIRNDQPQPRILSSTSLYFPPN